MKILNVWKRSWQATGEQNSVRTGFRLKNPVRNGGTLSFNGRLFGFIRRLQAMTGVGWDQWAMTSVLSGVTRVSRISR